jgi:hypothetical protein
VGNDPFVVSVDALVRADVTLAGQFFRGGTGLIDGLGADFVHGGCAYTSRAHVR